MKWVLPLIHRHLPNVFFLNETDAGVAGKLCTRSVLEHCVTPVTLTTVSTLVVLTMNLTLHL